MVNISFENFGQCLLHRCFATLKLIVLLFKVRTHYFCNQFSFFGTFQINLRNADMPVVLPLPPEIIDAATAASEQTFDLPLPKPAVFLGHFFDILPQRILRFFNDNVQLRND